MKLTIYHYLVPRWMRGEMPLFSFVREWCDAQVCGQSTTTTTTSASSSYSSSFHTRLFLLPPPLFLWLLDPFPGHGLPSRSSSSHSNVFSLCASFSIISNLAPSSHASSFQLPPSETSFHNSLWDSAVEHPCYMPSPPLYVYLHITVPCLDTICRFLHCTVVSTRH